jgi:hypothetical protein
MGEQYVGIDLHRRRSVLVRMRPAGEVLEIVRVDNDPVALSLELAKAGPDPEVVLEATYGWYWAADLLQACGARVHLAHPLGVKMFGYQRLKTDARDSRSPVDRPRSFRDDTQRNRSEHQARNAPGRIAGGVALSAFVADLVAAQGPMAGRRPADLARHVGYLTG